MKRHISIFALLLATIPTFGYNVFVFSSHPTEIVDKTGTTGFTVYSQDTHGYSDGGLQTGYSALVCDEANPLTAAGTDENKKFIGWYSKNGGWRYNIDDVTVESAADKVSDECALTWTEISGKAGEYGPTGFKTRVVVAKYVSLYKVEAEVVPTGAGTVSGTNTYEEGKLVTLRATAKSGYAFKGWSKDGQFSSSSNPLEFAATKDTAGTYTASFTGKVYTVTFNQQGGAGGADPVQAQYMESMPGPIAVPEQYGQTFGGYYSEPDGKGTQYYTSDGKSAHVWDKAMGATLYAKWIPQMGDFNLKFGTGVEKICYRLGESSVWTTNAVDTTVQVQVGTKIHAYGIPAAGYEITDYHKENQWCVEKMPKDGITFKPTAREITPVYTVTFVDPTGVHDPVRQSVEKGASAKAPTDWTRKGYGLSWDKDFSSVTADMTVIAVWTPNPYVIAFDGNGGAGEMDDLAAVYDKEIALTPNAFTNGIRTFLHWTATVDGKECTFTDGEIVSNLTDVAQGTNTLSAVWGEDYLVEFDANGATSGAMGQQRFVRDVRQSLSPNAYLRTGHTFLGWAADREKAVQEKVAYTNMEEVINLAPVGATNVLYATWSTNRYTVTFDANGGSGTMDDQVFSYGHAQNLDKCKFTRPTPWEFSGWTNEVTGQTYEDESLVSNLCAEADATVVLKAQWGMEVGELSEAMGCTNLKWIDGGALGEKKGWTVCKGQDVGYQSDSSALHQASDGADAMMHARISDPGTLTFRWRPTYDGEWLTVQLRIITESGEEFTPIKRDYKDGQVTSWDNQVEWTVPFNSEIDFSNDVFIEILGWKNPLFSGPSKTYVDAMVWTPDGTHPEPKPGDAVKISSAAVSDGKFVLSFKSDEKFDYNLLTNGNLLIKSWGILDTFVGDGSVHTFEPAIRADQPQLFYRVDTIQRK